MRKLLTVTVAAVLLFAVGHTSTGPDWHINATAIEGCTCPMFCQCYFNTKPAAHHSHGEGEAHFCRFNNAYRINQGHVGNVKLDGAHFWLSGDLGGDWSEGQMDWAVVTFDRKTTKEQREAIGAILPHLFPVKWNSVSTAEGDIAWQHKGESAVATIDGGKTAEVRLRAAQSYNKKGPITITNLRYFGAPRNDGFIMMPNEVQAYRVGEKAYESRGTNGFMLTFDMNSKDVQ